MDNYLLPISQNESLVSTFVYHVFDHISYLYKIMSISSDEFLRIQNELIRLKAEKHSLLEQLKASTTTSQTFLQSLFSGSEAQNIERLQKEENELKQSLSKLREQIDSLNEQFREIDPNIRNVDQIAVIETLFQTKKRELLRMKTLNDKALDDLNEEVEIAKSLCDSLDSGRASFAREKENIDSAIISLQASKQTIENRIKDLKELNLQLNEDLGIKSTVGDDYADLSAQIDEWQEKLQNLELEQKEINLEFDTQEKQLKIVEESKALECKAIKEEQQKQTQAVEEQLKSLKKELSTLKARNPTDETVVDIDIDSLIQENETLQSRYNELEKRNKELQRMVNTYQEECAYLANWLKTETRAHGNPEATFKQLQQLYNTKEEEFKALTAKK